MSEPRRYRCPLCEAVSANRNDLLRLYCAACHCFAEDELEELTYKSEQKLLVGQIQVSFETLMTICRILNIGSPPASSGQHRLIDPRVPRLAIEILTGRIAVMKALARELT